MAFSAARARSRVADFFVSRAVVIVAYTAFCISGAALVVTTFVPAFRGWLDGPILGVVCVSAVAVLIGMFVQSDRGASAAASTEV